MPAEQVTRYRQQLASHGPARWAGEAFGWFEMATRDLYERLIIESYQGRRYVLLSNEPADTMLMGGGAGWGLEDVGSEAVRGPGTAINIRLDEAGAQNMRQLSETHLHKRLAILVNDKVVSAPVVMSQLGAVLQIAGSFTSEEAEAIVKDLMRRVEETP